MPNNAEEMQNEITQKVQPEQNNMNINVQPNKANNENNKPINNIIVNENNKLANNPEEKLIKIRMKIYELANKIVEAKRKFHYIPENLKIEAIQLIKEYISTKIDIILSKLPKESDDEELLLLLQLLEGKDVNFTNLAQIRIELENLKEKILNAQTVEELKRYILEYIKIKQELKQMGYKF
jgi:hypothetical protein